MAEELYRVIELPPDVLITYESVGSKRKFWFVDEEGRNVLFKFNRLGSGEDWAEKVCAELAEALGLPHAEYDLARFLGERGVTSPLFHDPDNISLGNVILSRVISDYPGKRRAGKHLRVPQHTSAAIHQSLNTLDLRFGRLESKIEWVEDSFSQFLGYLLFDAWVANQDRHDENWGVLWHQGGSFSLAPTFDHASSLGYNLSQEERVQRLKSHDKGFQIPSFVRKARSAIYSNEGGRKPLGTLEAFMEAALLHPTIAPKWVERLASIADTDAERIVTRVPNGYLTDSEKEFTLGILIENKKRILELDWK